MMSGRPLTTSTTHFGTEVQTLSIAVESALDRFSV